MIKYKPIQQFAVLHIPFYNLAYELVCIYTLNLRRESNTKIILVAH